MARRSSDNEIIPIFHWHNKDCTILIPQFIQVIIQSNAINGNELEYPFTEDAKLFDINTIIESVNKQ